MKRYFISLLPIIFSFLLIIAWIGFLSPPDAQARESAPFSPLEQQGQPSSLEKIDAASIPLDHLVHVINGNPDNLDPALDYETIGSQVLQQIYDPLLTFKREKTDQFIPMLATGWSISPDGKTYTFQIRRNVKFHNGNALTPADVTYTFQRGILQGGTNSPQWLFTEAIFGTGIYDVCDLLDPSVCDDRTDLQNYQATYASQVRQVCIDLASKITVDDVNWTVTFHLNQAWGPLLSTLSGVFGSIIDKEWSIQNGAWNGDCNTWQNYYAATSATSPLRQIANGTGPFKLDHWTSGVEIVLTRNNGYWNTLPLWEGGSFGPAFFSQVNLPIFTSVSTSTEMLLNGEADLANINPSYISQLEAATMFHYPTLDTITPTLENSSGYLKKFTGGLSTSASDAFFTYNISNTGIRKYIGSGALDGNGIPPDFFTDPHVRKGFNYAFNWQTYIDTAFNGGAIQRRGPIIKPLVGYSETQPFYAYNPVAALAELNQAWAPFVATSGFSLTLAYRSDNPSTQHFAQVLEAGIEALDPKFHITLREITPSEYASDANNGRLPIFQYGWLQDIAHPHNWVQPILVGTRSTQQRMPSAMKSAYQTLVNNCVTKTGSEAQTCYEGLQNQTYLDAVDIFLAQSYLRSFTRAEVHGYFINPGLAGPRYYTLYKSPPPTAETVDPASDASMIFTTTTQTTATLDIPAGSVDDEVQIVAVPETIAYAASAEFLLSDITFELQAFTPSGEIISQLTFNNPVTITINYGAGAFSPEQESSLELKWWDGDQWVDAACGPYGRDLVNHILQVPICHLSEYAISEQNHPVFLPMLMR